jgi:RNA recognition motif-containing protein
MPKRNYVSPESGRGGGKRRKSLSNDESCTVFVGNLKYETPWQALKDHMRRAGNVDSVSQYDLLLFRNETINLFLMFNLSGQHFGG